MWGPAALWVAVLFSLSSWSNPTGPGWLMTVDDKVAHFMLFSVLGVALAIGRWWSGLAISHWIAIAVGMTYGALDELYQSTVPNRVPSLEDWYADVVGVWVGYLLVTYLVRRTGRTSGASPRTN
jgi:VanZ family protein